jgi:hypothetical protein
MPAEIPAWKVPLVREQSVYTWLADRWLEGKLGFAVLFRNGVVPLNDDSSQRLAPQTEKKSVSQIKEHHDGAKSDQRAQLAHELTGMMIPERWRLSQLKAIGGQPAITAASEPRMLGLARRSPLAATSPDPSFVSFRKDAGFRAARLRSVTRSLRPLPVQAGESAAPCRRPSPRDRLEG